MSYATLYTGDAMRLATLILAVGMTAACKNAPLGDGDRFGPFTQVKTFFTSAFVAETSEGVVVVDSGYSKEAKQVSKHLEDKGLTLDDVAHVVVTHGHTDHVRGLAAYPNARVWAHELEVALVREEAPEGFIVTDPLVDGEVFSIGGLDFETLHVPGHTPGNAAFLAGGVLLMGDTAMSFKDGTVGPAPERYSERPERARDELLALRDRLEPRRDEIEAVVFAHSEGLKDLRAFWEMSP